jgi:hypothetical protein
VGLTDLVEVEGTVDGDGSAPRGDVVEEGLEGVGR